MISLQLVSIFRLVSTVLLLSHWIFLFLPFSYSLVPTPPFRGVIVVEGKKNSMTYTKPQNLFPTKNAKKGTESKKRPPITTYFLFSCKVTWPHGIGTNRLLNPWSQKNPCAPGLCRPARALGYMRISVPSQVWLHLPTFREKTGKPVICALVSGSKDQRARNLGLGGTRCVSHL